MFTSSSINILLARIRCNIYCMYQIIRHLHPAQELLIYDKKDKVIIVASTKDIIWGNSELKLSMDKVFYNASEV